MSQQWYNPSPRPTWPAPSPTSSGMSPSMPQLGAGQDFFDPYLSDMSGYGPMGNMPETPWGAPEPSPNDYGFAPPMDLTPQVGMGPNGPTWMGPQFEQGGMQPPQQQQGPTGHPILDRLMSPDMADRAMAAAIFARGFVAPQEAINWAMQIRSQRQAQQARQDQSKAEWDARKEVERYKGEQDKYEKNRSRAGQLINQANVTARQSGIDPLEFFSQNPDFNPDDPVHADAYSKWVLGKNAEVKGAKLEQEKAQKELDNEVKVAGQVLKTGKVPSNFANSELANAASEEYGRLRAREQEFDRYKLDLEKSKVAIAKAAAGTFKSAEWTYNMRRLTETRMKVSQFERELFLLQQQERYMAVLPDEQPMKASWMKQVEAAKEQLDKWTMDYEETDAKLRDMVNGAVKQSTTLAPDGGDPNADGVQLPEDVATEFAARYTAAKDSAARERLKSFIKGKFPGVVIENYIPAGE